MGPVNARTTMNSSVATNASVTRIDRTIPRSFPLVQLGVAPCPGVYPPLPAVNRNRGDAVEGLVHTVAP